MSELVSKCVLRVEVDQNCENDKNKTMEQQQQEENQRKSQEIYVETFPSRLEQPRDDWGLIPISSREQTPLKDNNNDNKKIVEEMDDEIGFFSGNPFVEITKGILHLYKEDVLTDRREALTLCLLGVPTSMTCHDLLAFTAPCHADISHIRVLRDSSPNQYMALLTFRTHDSAMEFYLTFNCAPYNSLEPDIICHIVWVSRIEWAHDGVPPPGHTELPTCPVCLERMDESVDGVLTILCNHAFHANCLEKWSDSTCPVCRCVQSPEQVANSECEQCGKSGATAVSPDALWICLICGHVGCGRYQGGHAALHYRESGHCYALQLSSLRVWDYKGDNFVHRLLQNKADGKLVASEGPPPSDSDCAQEKIDSVQLEFTYLLTSQLDEQRLYFEEKLKKLDNQYMEQIQLLQNNNQLLNEQIMDIKQQLNETRKEKQSIEKRLQQQTNKLTICLNDLNEERQLGKALRNNQQQWQNKLQQLQQENELKNTEIQELKEQVRDLMFFIDAQKTIEQSEDKDDIAGGTITINQTTTTTDTNGRKHRKNRRNK